MEFKENLAGRIKTGLFRFSCIYILLYTLPAPYTYIPGISYAAQLFTEGWNLLGIWFGETILPIGGTIRTNATGSGDRTIDYIQLLLCLILSVLGALVWIALDRKRKEYHKLSYWMRLHVRYYLFAMFFVYGMAKVIKIQFSSPGITRLLQPLGEMSPMGLAWTFMGFSEPYTIFAGLMEVLAAVLLLFRKTTLLGAFVGAGVMSNVVMMNFSYDIPVKLFSLHLLLFSFFLLWFDGRRILNFFISNKSVAPDGSYVPYFSEKWKRYSVLGLKSLFAGYIMITITWHAWGRYQQTGPNRDTSPLYGLYEVDSFILDGIEMPPLVTDEQRWRYLIFDRPGFAVIKQMNDEISSFRAEIDTTQKIIKIDESSVLQYQQEGMVLELEGTWNGDSLVVKTQNHALNDFLLLGRGFNWIQEHPHNR